MNLNSIVLQTNLLLVGMLGIAPYPARAEASSATKPNILSIVERVAGEICERRTQHAWADGKKRIKGEYLEEK